MNYHKQIAKIARFLGCKMSIPQIKIQDDNTVRIKVVIDGALCRFHLAEYHNKYDFRQAFLARLTEIQR